MFQSAGGAFAKPPAELPLAYTATAITIGAFGNPGQAAIAVAAGREVWVVQAQASPASATRTPGFDVDKIAAASAGIELKTAPEGYVKIHPNHHLWSKARIGEALINGQFKVVAESPSLIEPNPFPKGYQ